MNRENSATMFWPHDENDPRKIDETNSAGYTHGKAPRGRPRTRLRDYTSDLAWPRLNVEPVGLFEIAENSEVFRVLLGLLPSDPPQRKSGIIMK